MARAIVGKEVAKEVGKEVAKEVGKEVAKEARMARAIGHEAQAM